MRGRIRMHTMFALVDEQPSDAPLEEVSPGLAHFYGSGGGSGGGGGGGGGGSAGDGVGSGNVAERKLKCKLCSIQL